MLEGGKGGTVLNRAGEGGGDERRTSEQGMGEAVVRLVAARRRVVRRVWSRILSFLLVGWLAGLRWRLLVGFVCSSPAPLLGRMPPLTVLWVVEGIGEKRVGGRRSGGRYEVGARKSTGEEREDAIVSAW